MNDEPFKVTLAAAQQVSFNALIPLYSCLGVCVLAASLRQRGVPCELLDLAGLDTLNESILQKMREVGCYEFFSAFSRLPLNSSL